MTDPVALDALLAACASEPIHAPGAVQRHGALLVLDGAEVVRAASENVAELLGVAAGDLLGRPLAVGLGAAWVDALAIAIEEGLARVATDRGAFECVAVTNGDLVLLEIEPDEGDTIGDHWRLYRTLLAFQGAASVEQLVQDAVVTVADLTRYDRVMAYRFDPEWNGEVVADAVVDGVTSFLGLRYPASDIPPQARAQYERTRLRLIADSLATPSPLLAHDASWAADLDLSDATLRAVSPVHLEYLRNMGVRSSMSVSITVEGRLWGLIACHHLTEGFRPSRRVRNAVELVAATTSTMLGVLLANQATERRLAALDRLDQLGSAVARDVTRAPFEVLEEHADDTLDLVGATGAALVAGTRTRLLGRTPPADVISDLIEHARGRNGPLVVEELAGVEPAWRTHAQVAAGALVTGVGAYDDRWIVWFRPETAETVRWGGDPTEKGVAERPDGALRLSPRASFAEYLEEVRGRAQRFTIEEVDAGAALASRVSASLTLAVKREAELAGQLQRMLLLEAFPSIAGVTGAAQYRPAEGSPLGGDWYDVLYLPNGRCIVAVGDVAGHGLEVAASMAQLRHALRAYLLRAPSLGEALRRLNELIHSLLPDEMATLVLAELDPETRTVQIVNAGHPPPVVVGASGARLIETHGMVLGVLSDAPYEQVAVPLHAGERLVLYSDGLIERRGRVIDEGFAALRAAARATVGLDVAGQSAVLVEELTDGTDVVDDVTVVVVAFDDESD